MRTRLADIAERAGVSEATVSRVLNDKPGVSPEARQAVLAAADDLAYGRPGPPRPRRSRLIGLVVPELTNPVFPVIVQNIENLLARHGYTPLLCTHSPGGGLLEDDYITLLLEHGVAGIIFVSGMHADTKADADRYRELIARRLPVAFINGYVPGLDAPFVSCDDGASAELAVGHLADLGHHQIGLVLGPERYMPVIRKRDGFLRAMRDKFGVDASGLIVNAMFSVEGGWAAGLRLLERDVTAVVCSSDVIALGVIRAARDRGLAVPRDLSVVGYDDSPLMAFTDPPLSTVRQPVREMCMAAVQMLIDERPTRTQERPDQRPELIFRPELVARGSTGPAPISKPSLTLTTNQDGSPPAS
jgi:alanine racemase